jgi:ADP-heptose:LPS heptosyltransferase
VAVTPAGAPRLVVLRALGLGDFLTGVPALRALAAAFPGHERLLLAPAFVRPLAALLGGVVHGVVETEGRGAPPAMLPDAARGADVAVNLHGRGPRSHEALRAAAPGRLVAFVCPEAGLADGPEWRAGGDLEDLARLVAGAARVACADTGVAHLATALGVPSVVLFGPTPPAEWGPPPDRDRHRVLWAGRRGDPNGPAPDPGLLEIEPAAVSAELAAL